MGIDDELLDGEGWTASEFITKMLKKAEKELDDGTSQRSSEDGS